MRSSTGFSGSANGAHCKYQTLAFKSGKGKSSVLNSETVREDAQGTNTEQHRLPVHCLYLPKAETCSEKL